MLPICLQMTFSLTQPWYSKAFKPIATKIGCLIYIPCCCYHFPEVNNFTPLEILTWINMQNLLTLNLYWFSHHFANNASQTGCLLGPASPVVAKIELMLDAHLPFRWQSSFIMAQFGMPCGNNFANCNLVHINCSKVQIRVRNSQIS